MCCSLFQSTAKKRLFQRKLKLCTEFGIYPLGMPFDSQGDLVVVTRPPCTSYFESQGAWSIVLCSTKENPYPLPTQAILKNVMTNTNNFSLLKLKLSIYGRFRVFFVCFPVMIDPRNWVPCVAWSCLDTSQIR